VDNFLGRGSGALFVALVVGFVGALLVLGCLRWLLYLAWPDSNGWMHQFWTTFLELTDPGNMSQDNDTGALFKVTAVLGGFTGVTIFSALIAFLTTGLDQALGELKKGHSPVLESGHTLILGWSPRVSEILRELFEANESNDDPVIVILADTEKETMDDHLRQAVPDRRNTRLVTRSGSTASLDDLERVNAGEAKSAIVLATCPPSASNEEQLVSDARVIKTVLALNTAIEENPEFAVVAEIFTPRNRQVVEDIAPGRVSVVDTEEILAKIMVQTSRTSGLAVVYQELLGFEGCEMYFHRAPWGGLRFDQLQFHFPDGVPIGIRRGDGEIVIRPPVDHAMAADDDVLIIADDDSTIHFQSAEVMRPEERDIPERHAEQRRERMLILGWSRKAPIIISEYADYVLENSMIDVVVHQPSRDVIATVKALDESNPDVTLALIDKDPLSSPDLASLDPLRYDNIVILPQNPDLAADPERVDSETIVVLLHLRKLFREADQRGQENPTKLITEVLDSSNQELINKAGVNDFIISNRMVSMLFAQLSEEPAIKLVYDNLFEEAGSEIYVKPVELYFDQLPTSCRFGDLMRLAQKRDGEVCIGYKTAALKRDSRRNYGLRLIPPKDEVITVSPGDGMVVVAENDR
jgi:hypothetical protein